MNQSTIVNGELVERLDEIDADMAAAFEDFRAKLGEDEDSGGWMKVYRIPLDFKGEPVVRGKNRSHLFSFMWGQLQPDEVIEKVRAEYMRKGETKITIQITGGRNNARGLLINRMITLERPNDSQAPEQDSLSKLMAAMGEMQNNADSRFEKILAVMTAQRGAGGGDMDSIMKMMTVMGGMFGMMMQAMRPQVPAPGTPGAPADPFEQMTKMMTLLGAMKSFNAGGDAINSTASDVDSFGSILANMAKIAQPVSLMLEGAKNAPKRAPARPGAPAPTPPAPQIPPTITPPNTSAKTPGEKDVNAKLLKENIGFVIDLQKEGKTPAEVASLIMNVVPESQVDELLAIVDADDFVANMITADSRVADAREWWEALANEIAARIDPDAATEGDANGNANG